MSIAALACYKPEQPSRLIYRPRPDTRPDGRKSFAWTDYRDLIQAAHHQLGGPIVLVWDNLNTHLASGMRRYIAADDWLTAYQLPLLRTRSQPRPRGPAASPAPDFDPLRHDDIAHSRSVNGVRHLADQFKSCRRQRTLLERESNLAFAHITAGVVDTALRERAAAAIGAQYEGVVRVFEVERVSGRVLLRPGRR